MTGLPDSADMSYDHALLNRNKLKMKSSMNPEMKSNEIGSKFSAYLDILRFLAALLVFFHHLYAEPFSSNIVHWRLASHGPTAVTLFFVLSGFVIAHVVSTKERNLKHYLFSRISRVYSVVIVALVLTFVCDSIGSALNPDFYSINSVLQKPPSLIGYISSFFFVNEYQIFNFNGIAPGTNGPYWSLSFEIAYYVIAGLMIFCRALISVPLSFIILFVAGRTVTALLPVWVLGFVLFKINTQYKRIPSIVSASTMVFSAVILMYIPWSKTIGNFDNFGIIFPWNVGLSNRNLFADYIAAAVFAMHLLSARVLLSRSTDLKRHWTLKKCARWLGSLTFPLYLFHQPLICMLAAISPWHNNYKAHVAFLCVGTAIVVIVLTPLCNYLKDRMRQNLNGKISFMRGRAYETGCDAVGK